MLPQDRRLSKHVIVDASIAYHKTQRTRLHSTTQELRELLGERDELLHEVNAFRSLYQPDVLGERVAKQVNPAVLEILALDEAALPVHTQMDRSTEEQSWTHNHEEVGDMLSSTGLQQSDLALMPYMGFLPSIAEDPLNDMAYSETNIPGPGDELRNSGDGEILQIPDAYQRYCEVIGPNPAPATISPTDNTSTLPQLRYNRVEWPDGVLGGPPAFSRRFS